MAIPFMDVAQAYVAEGWEGLCPYLGDGQGKVSLSDSAYPWKLPVSSQKTE